MPRSIEYYNQKARDYNATQYDDKPLLRCGVQFKIRERDKLPSYNLEDKSRLGKFIESERDKDVATEGVKDEGGVSVFSNIDAMKAKVTGSCYYFDNFSPNLKIRHTGNSHYVIAPNVKGEGLMPVKTYISALDSLRVFKPNAFKINKDHSYNLSPSFETDSLSMS